MLLEREDELRELEALLGHALRGQARVGLLEGPPGIGKTRLLEAVRGLASSGGATVLSARASELDREFPFGIVRQLFEPVVARREDVLRGAAAHAAPLLSADAAFSVPAAPDASLAIAHGLYWVVANLCENSPLVLAVDDVHWSDAESMRFLRFLVPRLDELPVLLVLATRDLEPEMEREQVDAIAADPRTRVICPRPLSGRAVAALVADELSVEGSAEFTSACRDATGGNPFLVRELLRELVREGVDPSADAVPLVRRLAPPVVSHAVLLRLARLGQDAMAVARAVVVLGDGAVPRHAAVLAGLPEVRAERAAAALASAGVFATRGGLGFAHSILRAAVDGDIDALARDSAHRRAAQMLVAEGATPDVVGVHLLATSARADAGTVALLRAAAERATARGAPSAAVALLRRALAEPPVAADRAALVSELASAELHAGEPAAAVEHFEEAAGLTGDDPRARAALVFEHALALQAVGRGGEVAALRERAAAEVAGVDRELALAIEASLIASAGLDLSRVGWARERLDAVHSRSPSPAAQQLQALRAYFEALYGHAPAAPLADLAERALGAGALRESGIGGSSTAFFAAVETLWLADRVQPARRELDEGIERARRRGSALAFAALTGWRCMLLARSGDLVAAEADALGCAELALAHGWFSLGPPMLGYVLTVLIERGLVDEAERVLAGSGVASLPAGDDLSLFPVLHARARLRALRGDLAGGREDMAALARRGARWCTDLTVTPALLVAPELAASPTGAVPARMLDEARVWGTPRALGMALHAHALPGGDVTMLSEAVAVLAESPARLEHARALADLGAAQLRGGDRASARSTLRLALDAADACGAVPLASRARGELRAAGARPRRARIGGAAALTASERRIAEMAASGLSNPEIAQALFVTKKTVETHLGNVFRKLDIRSRAGLREALAED